MTEEKQLEMEVTAHETNKPVVVNDSSNMNDIDPTNEPNTEDDEESIEYELRPTIYNLYPLLRQNEKSWNSLDTITRYKLLFWLIITPFSQVLLGLLVTSTVSGTIATDWIDDYYRWDDSLDAEEPPDTFESGRERNYFRLYRASMADLFVPVLIFVGMVYIQNELNAIYREYVGLRRLWGISLEKEVKRQVNKNFCGFLEINMFKKSYLFTFGIKIVLEAALFIGFSMLFFSITLDQIQLQFWSDNSYYRYADAVLNLLAFVFIFEFDDWVFEIVLGDNLKPLNGTWNNEMLNVSLNSKFDNTPLRIRIVFYVLLVTMNFFYFSIMLVKNEVFTDFGYNNVTIVVHVTGSIIYFFYLVFKEGVIRFKASNEEVNTVNG